MRPRSIMMPAVAGRLARDAVAAALHCCEQAVGPSKLTAFATSGGVGTSVRSVRDSDRMRRSRRAAPGRSRFPLSAVAGLFRLARRSLMSAALSEICFRGKIDRRNAARTVALEASAQTRPGGQHHRRGGRCPNELTPADSCYSNLGESEARERSCHPPRFWPSGDVTPDSVSGRRCIPCTTFAGFVVSWRVSVDV